MKKVFSLFHRKNMNMEEMTIKELEKAMEQLKKENNKIEKAQNRAKQLNQRINKLKRSAETQRKIRKGGVFEAFEREITGRQEDTNNDLIYAFLDYVLSDNRNREKLKELTEIHIKDKEIDVEETKNPDDENDKLDNQKVENSDEDMEDDFLENED
jgi:sugar-specific transcriptional regulator TrmB